MNDLIRDEEKGSIWERNVQIVTFRQKTFQELCKNLKERFGLGGSAALYTVGFSAGSTALNYSRHNISTNVDLTKGLDSVLSQRGWGRIESIRTLSDSERSYEVSLRNSALAEGLSTSESVCDMLRGVCAGWLAEYYHSEVFLAEETSCAAKGDPLCIFKIMLGK